ncbi:electron transport complex subunit RsxD [Ferrimonas balearica]|uniref:electron transport complex subunit RsxD n=1 Tax=Ferrimonas balearica TaxID=44012 RepID=UPI001C585A1D|nr:electron transport complex subunit RsxD [Ferrimonas balearica]MBW3139342.1 electron transport complex subunit RsxD [Ferrimonas balearica]MBW3163068.1 electron transport complex subunit RsxD [Ferrimonas balearica]MBY5980761.1 electron transport complex subunit RsxD [Ferrimonas balearica]MBY6106410.1 electron transport complex subunit RsxD [Ferrimonas balearica]
MAFKMASSPHIQGRMPTHRVMQWVALCTLPGIVAQWWFFGWGNLVQIALAVTTALVAEAVCVKARGRNVRVALSDCTALVTGLLLGICLPPLAPWYISVLGAVFAIVLVKQLYGGIGQNLFNPAMGAYVALLISFPLQMTQWLPPQSLAATTLGPIDTLVMVLNGEVAGHTVASLRLGIDGATMATPLDTLKTDLTLGLTAGESLTKPVFSSLAGVGWEWVNLAFLLGGLVMLKLKVIRWHIPVAMIATLGLCALIGQILHPDGTGGVTLHLLSGATLFGAFFIATDPVTAATSNRGRLVFGALIGLLVYLIRSFGGYPDAVAFAVMLANMSVPLIDYYTRPRTYGHGGSR